MMAARGCDEVGVGGRVEHSTRRAGVRRAWRATGHLRASLAAFVVVAVLFRYAGRFIGLPRAVLSVLEVAASVGLIVLLVLITRLVTQMLLGLLQAATGVPDRVRLVASLPRWARPLAFAVFLLVGCVVTTLVVILLMALSMRVAGLVK